MYNDLGKPIDEAGPSAPVRITGLDEVPDADDPFHVVPDLSIGSRDRREAQGQAHGRSAKPKRQTLTLETLAQKKITELKVILKADFRGSVEAIRKELEKLQHEEVRVRMLHAGIGGITESDVQLALTSPDETRRSSASTWCRTTRPWRWPKHAGSQIREYDIIYNLTDDIKAALEGKLKPREEVVHLGRARRPRDVQASVASARSPAATSRRASSSGRRRSGVIREGVVVYPPPDKVVGLESLKRFKDDVREVREGFECGIKIAGYDDIKVGDVIEAYRIEQVKRTL